MKRAAIKDLGDQLRERDVASVVVDKPKGEQVTGSTTRDGAAGSSSMHASASAGSSWRGRAACMLAAAETEHV